MTKIYIASKANHRPTWRAFRQGGHNIISRWIDTDDKFTADPGELDFQALWDTCVEDVLACDVLVCYIERDEVLKGALLEIGIALGSGKRVILVGPRAEYLKNGTWINHRAIEHWADFRIGEVLQQLYVKES